MKSFQEDMIQNEYNKRGLFVSGTDTGIGKTIFCSLLLSALRTHYLNANYFKPIQTGVELDTSLVAQLNPLPLSKFPNPAYYFSKPAAPYLAAQEQGEEININFILKKWNTLKAQSKDFWIVEGAGGLLVPLNSKNTIRDLIFQMDLELLLVASTRLGTMNHTALSIEAAQKIGIKILGIVLIGNQDSQLVSILEEMTGVQVLFQIPWLSSISSQEISQFAKEYFKLKDLEKLIYE